MQNPNSADPWKHSGGGSGGNEASEPGLEEAPEGRARGGGMSSVSPVTLTASTCLRLVLSLWEQS